MQETEEIKALQSSITELQRMHDEVNETYRDSGFKVLTFLGSSFAILSYLYAGGDLFIPPAEQLYGRIIYFGALCCFLVGIAILFQAMRPVVWSIPTEIRDHNKLKFDDHLDFLRYIRDEYSDSLTSNISHCNKKQSYLNIVFPLLMVGGTILVIIKNFL